MRIHRLTLSAFGPYKGEQTIQFDQLNEKQLFLIAGPTGSGKTTLFDAITYVLYGKSSGNGREADDFVSQFKHIEDETYVEMAFTIKGKDYVIRRSPRQERLRARGSGTTTRTGEARLLVDDTILTSISEVNEKIESLLGIDVNQFKQIVMLPQGEFRKLLEANSSEKEVIFRNLFKTDYFKAFQEFMHEKVKLVDGEIRDKKIELKEVSKNIYPAQDEQLKEALEKEDLNYPLIIESTEAVNHNILQQYRQMEETLVAANQKRDVLKDRLNETKMIIEKQGKLHETQSQLALLRENEWQVKEQQHQIMQFSEARFVQEAEQLHRKEKERLESLTQDLSQQQTLLTQLKGDHDQLKVDLSEAYKQYVMVDDLKSSRQTWRERYEKYESWMKLTDKISQMQRELTKDQYAIAKLVETINQLHANQVLLEQQNEQLEAHLKQEQDLTIRKFNSQNKRTLMTQLKTRVEVLSQLKIHHQKESSIYSDLEEQRNQEKHLYEQHYQNYLRSQAGMLAQTLITNEACPVCGSSDHPKPATMTEGTLTREALETYRKQVGIIEQKVSEQYQKVIQLYEQMNSQWDALPEVEDWDIEITRETDLNFIILAIQEKISEWNNAVKQLENELKQLEENKERVEKNKQLIQDAKVSMSEYTLEKETKVKAYQLVEKAYLIEKGQWEHLANDHQFTLNQETEIRQHIEELDQKISTIERNYHVLEQQFNEVKQIIVKHQSTIQSLELQLEKAKQDQKEYEELYHVRLQNAQFESTEAYHAILQMKGHIDLMEHAVKQHYEEKSYLEKQEVQLIEELKAKVVEDLDALHDQIQQVETTIEQLGQQSKENYAIYNQNNQALSKMKKLFKSYANYMEEFQDISYLSNITTGKNNFKLSFERYVLTAYFDDIVYAANLRLKEMTQGRYILLRDDDYTTGRGHRGLELLVFDHYTNQKRDVKTLSGGESFMASLALALGLADVVASYAGGIELDTIFIDEGFGTLDPVSLDHAIETLNNLKNHGRIVGIISHVQELKDRVDGRIEIVKSKDGSRVNVIV